MDGVEEQNISNEILHKLNACRHQVVKFQSEIEGKDVIVCMGNTRCGKSTVVNHLQGNRLEAFRDTKRTYIKACSLHDGPTITHGSVSCTRLPTVWNIQGQSDTVIVDVPGFGDNRGAAQDVLNTVFFNRLKYARSIKLLLISDINDINVDNVGCFINAVTTIQMILDDIVELKDALAVVFTKDTNIYEGGDIRDLLKKKILDVSALKVKKDLVYEIIKHTERIGIFRMPLREGPVVKEEVDYNIEGAISNTHPIIINTQNIKFVPSVQSHNILLAIYQKYLNEMDFDLELFTILERYRNYFNVDKYVFASTEDELDTTKTRLQYYLTLIKAEHIKNLPNLRELQRSLSNIVNTVSEDLDSKLHFLKFMEEISLLDVKIRQMTTTKYKNSLSDLIGKIEKLITKIDSEVEDRTTETIQYILSEAASDKAKLVLMGASLIPVATKTLSALGLGLPTCITFSVLDISAAGWGLAGAGAVGVAVGGYGVHYYQTVHLRRKLRKQQGR